jgi:hypothetical protein
MYICGGITQCDLRHSVFGISEFYWWDGPGIVSQWGRDFPHPSRPALGPTQLLVQWVTTLLPGAKWLWRGVVLTTHPIQRRGQRKSRAIPLLLIWTSIACSRVNFIFERVSAPFQVL